MAYPNLPGAEERSAPVLAWRDGGVAHLRFNRPQSLNAIDVAMADAFCQACGAIAADRQVRVVVVSGEGRAFLAGGDVAAMRESPVAISKKLIAGMHGGLEILGNLDAPLVASLHGAVAGAGIGVAVICDLAIAAEGTRFSIAYPLIGASADCATSWGLPRVVGLRNALRIALLAESFDAAQALRYGLVNEVVPAAELQPRTHAWAQQLAQGAPLALARLKHLLRRSGERSLKEQLDAEAEAFALCAASADFAEGTAAFLEKRKPTFVGR
ncbi:MAG TPA: enoyl-CoA hydratase-related protein [Burkholderiaceae bacterium]|nr:enoyl-CoA hydratase-related protein [Burkholderiaceae bacterium]